jgi:hypothetical protein
MNDKCNTKTHEPANHILLPHDQRSRDVIIKPAPFNAHRVMKVAQGSCIHEIVDQMYTSSGLAGRHRDYALMVEIDGKPLPREAWHYVPSPNEHILIFAPVRGDDKGNMGRAIMMIAVVIASVYTGGALAPYGVVVQAAGQAVVATAGMLLVNAIAPIRNPTSPAAQKAEKDVYGITGSQNQANPFGPVPVVLGTHLMFPNYGTLPYTEIIGGVEYLFQLFIWGEGPLSIDTASLKIGDTLLTNYTDYEIEHREGRVTDEPITLIPARVYTEQVGLKLTYAEWRSVVRAAQPGAAEIAIDGIFPAGLTRHNEDGARIKCTMWVGVFYREIGADDWIAVTELTFSEKTYKAVRFSHRWALPDPTKSYEVAVTRNGTDVSDPRTLSDVYWSAMKSIVNKSPVNYPRPLAMTAIKIKATEQLNGVISSLNGVVSSYATPWDGAEWTGEEVTSNPAALYRLVLMHPANARARTASQISGAQLGEWYDFCVTQGYAFNMVRYAVSSVWDCLADIAASGRGSPSLAPGLWTTIYDYSTSPIAQHIVPRNSWGFSVEKVFYTHPHGFRVRFRNELNNWEWDERIVLDDGYQLNGKDAFGNDAPALPAATLFEAIEFPGITHPDLIWRFARYQIAQARLRAEKYSAYMDFEHLVCHRGSRVRVAHDVPMWGSKWGRIKYLIYDETAENVVGVGLDEKFVIVPPAQYVIRIRRADEDNTSQLINLSDMEAGEHTAAIFDTPVPIVTAPEVGDLCIIGEYGKETTECLVKGVYIIDDLAARLELVDAASAIYDADTGTIPAFDTNITRISDIIDIPPPAPSLVSIQSGTNTLETTPFGSIRARISVTCAAPSGSVRINRFRLRYRPVETTLWEYAEAPVENPTAWLTDVEEGESYQIQAQAVSVYNIYGPWCVAATHTVVGQSEAPSDVEYFSCNIVGSEAHLSWLPVTDIDLSHYRIRWSPLAEGAVWGDAIDVVERVGKPATHMTVPAMIGSYLIKAVDYVGKESSVAAVAKTNISHIPGYTTAGSFEQPDPDWSGTGDGADYDSDFGGIALILSGGEGGADLTFEGRPEDDLEWGATEHMIFGERTSEPVILEEGYYAFDNTIDLDGVYTVRMYADMTTSSADISTDLYDLQDLYDVLDLYASREGVCGVDLEMRFTADDPDGSPTWSEWQRVLVGDYTARAFQFRAVLWTTVGTVTPILTAITVYLDMADRVHPFDASVEIGGSPVVYSPPFFATPAVGIAVANGQAGDSYAITGHTRAGFTIAFSNGGSGVARTISGVARGYGEEET